GIMEEEKRTEGRMLCADMMDVRWTDRSGKQRKAAALLEDISAAGACIQLETPVPVGAEIRWHASGQFFSASVRYCAHRETGYFVGVEFGKSTRWSKETYCPKHLLDLGKLAARYNPAAGRAATVPTRTRG